MKSVEKLEEFVEHDFSKDLEDRVGKKLPVGFRVVGAVCGSEWPPPLVRYSAMDFECIVAAKRAALLEVGFLGLSSAQRSGVSGRRGVDSWVKSATMEPAVEARRNEVGC